MSSLIRELIRKSKTPSGKLITGALVGSTVTLLFFPAQQQIQHYFWEKQNQQILNQNKIEKRLSLLNDFTTEYTRYNWCSIRVGVIGVTGIVEEDPIVCFMDSSAKLAGLALQAKYYFTEPVISKLDEISEAILIYENDMHDGKLNTDSDEKLNKLFGELLINMQDTMLSDV